MLMTLVFSCKSDKDSVSPEEPACKVQTISNSFNGGTPVVTTAEYNAQNLLASFVTSSTTTTGVTVTGKETYEYDNNGYLLVHKIVSNPGQASERVNVLTTYKYENGRIVEQKFMNIYTLVLDTQVTQDTSSSSTRYIYNAAGRLTTFIDDWGYSVDTYNFTNGVLTSASSRISGTDYPMTVANGRIEAVSGPGNYRYRHIYDAKGYRVKFESIGPDGTVNFYSTFEYGPTPVKSFEPVRKGFPGIEMYGKRDLPEVKVVQYNQGRQTSQSQTQYQLNAQGYPISLRHTNTSADGSFPPSSQTITYTYSNCK